jgi:RNA polymerase sigma factor (sigma-70 family)
VLETFTPEFHTAEYWESIGFTKDPEALVRRHASFVQSIARGYFHPSLGLGFEDLLQEGFSGLLEAASRFRPERGCKFITYAAWWVRKPILRLISEQSQNIKIPAYRWSGILQARRARGEAQSDGPGVREGAREEHMRRALEPLIPLSLGEISLEETFDTEVTLREYLKDTRAPDPLAHTLRGESHALLAKALGALAERERAILRRHYGLDGHEPVTLQVIGEELGLTRERIRQIEQDALGKLVRWMRRHQRGFPN